MYCGVIEGFLQSGGCISIKYSRIADIYDIYVYTWFDVDYFLKELGSDPGDGLELMSGTGMLLPCFFLPEAVNRCLG